MLQDMEDRAKDVEAELELTDRLILDAENRAHSTERERTTLENAVKRAQLDAKMSKVAMAPNEQDTDEARMTLEKMRQEFEDLHKAASTPVSHTATKEKVTQTRKDAASAHKALASRCCI